jgi:hypothetical protein
MQKTTELMSNAGWTALMCSSTPASWFSDTQIRFKRRVIGAQFGVVEFVAMRAGTP